MQTYTMAITKNDPNTGRPFTEYVRHLTEDELPARREAARQNTTMGDTINIRVTADR